MAKTGHVFQSSHDFGEPISFPLNGVIAGWTKGVPGMKVGGTRRLLIPAALAYGGRPPYGSGIPVNADLVFDIELVAIEGK
ncbi:MAG TPA: FKBP-type peptidyl-prolyl cis-trans isomerase [Verrucomicrobiae bacterium]|nr:FKBP-type peptidyl-prolyl cis-trans isomerase [Verrucomicrobiae bacterium]